MIHEIFVVEDEEDLINDFKKIFKTDKKTKFKKINTTSISAHLLDIPSLIIINEDKIYKNNLIDICKLIRNNEDNSITPIMIITSDNSLAHQRNILKEEIEYYIKKPLDNDCIFYMIKNIVKLLYRNRGISPLTKLPGNLPIQSELKKRLLKKQEFAVLYFDLDNFKAYNDVYGFLKGDEIIEFTAGTIINCIHESGLEDTFIRTHWRRRLCSINSRNCL